MSEVQNKNPQQGLESSPVPQGQPIYSLQQTSQYTVGYPPLYPYPPPPSSGESNGAPSDPVNGVPGAYMMAFPPPPPGMIYAYPATQGLPTET